MSETELITGITGHDGSYLAEVSSQPHADSAQSRANTVSIDPIRVTPFGVAGVLGALATLLIVASIIGQFTKYLFGHGSVHGLVPLFYVDAEHNIPTLFSFLLLLFAALILSVISIVKKQQKNAELKRWRFLAAGFLFMAIDEACAIHENLISPVKRLMGDNAKGLFNFAWVIPGIAVVLVLGVFFFRFLLRLPGEMRSMCVIAATVFLSGVIGFELLGGRYAALHGTQNLTYSMIATLEESLEMAGMVIFIYALLKYFADNNYGEVRFRIVRDLRPYRDNSKN